MDVKSRLEQIAGRDNVLSQQPLAAYTSFKVGGAADYLVTPGSMDQVAELLSFCGQASLPWHILGRGTNLLVSDSGVRGVVIRISDNLAAVSVCDATITAQAGAILTRVSSMALAHSLSGMEFAEGIPGTVGGAVVMNAGAYQGEMKDVLRQVQAVTPQGDLVSLSAGELQLGYRSSVFQQNRYVVAEVEMELVPGSKMEIKEKMASFSRQRREKQPLDKASAGSTFRRPTGYYAGQLVDQCGLRGKRIGGAMVSTKHCGFIVNEENASADDIYQLIRHVKQRVKEEQGVELETEVQFWGQFGDK